MIQDHQLLSPIDHSAISASRNPRLQTIAMTLLCLALVATGCAKPPTEAHDQAQRVISDARAAGAAEYPIDGLKAAEEAFDKASSAMTEKKYQDAEEHFAAAVKEAQAALGRVAQARETTRRTAEETFAMVRQDLDHAAELVERLEGCKIPGKDPQSAPGILQARLELVRADLTAGEQTFGAGEFNQAVENASDADDEAGKLVAALEEALQEGTCP